MHTRTSLRWVALILLMNLMISLAVAWFSTPPLRIWQGSSVLPDVVFIHHRRAVSSPINPVVRL